MSNHNIKAGLLIHKHLQGHADLTNVVDRSAFYDNNTEMIIEQRQYVDGRREMRGYQVGLNQRYPEVSWDRMFLISKDTESKRSFHIEETAKEPENTDAPDHPEAGAW